MIIKLILLTGAIFGLVIGFCIGMLARIVLEGGNMKSIQRNNVIIGNNNIIKNSNISQSIVQKNGNTYINGEKVEMPKSIFFNNTIVQNNNKTYLNGKELKNGKWKYTFKSIFNTIF